MKDFFDGLTLLVSIPFVIFWFLAVTFIIGSQFRKVTESGHDDDKSTNSGCYTFGIGGFLLIILITFLNECN